MDMSNATAAGPSQGLFEILFGGAKEEGTETDGQGFMSLMNMISGANNKNQEDDKGNRTAEEIASGKGVVDYSAVGMPVMLPTLPVPSPQGAEGKVAEEKVSTVQMLQALPGGKLLASMEAAKPGAVDPALVNRLLQEKSLPPLSPEEIKLLTDVNGKLAKVSGAEGKIPAPELAAPDTKVPADPQAAALARELAKKGIDPQQVKGDGAQTAAPKLLSTEAYLQMHERLQGPKPQAKNETESAKRLGGDEAVNAKASADAVSPTQVSGPEQKGKDLFGKADHKQAENPLKGEKEAAKLSSAPFAGALLHASKSDLDTRDVVLNSTNPAEIREALVGEVNQGVGFHAVKGGGEMRLVIHPEALGEVKLKISTRSDGKVEVQASAQNEDVAKIIRGGSKDLESSLRDQNLTLAKFDVSVTPDAPMASTDTRNSLSDQFLPNQQNPQSGFSQAGTDSRQGFAQWNGNQQGRPFSSDGMTNDQSAGSGKRAPVNKPARNGSGRLDVVA